MTHETVSESETELCQLQRQVCGASDGIVMRVVLPVLFIHDDRKSIDRSSPAKISGEFSAAISDRMSHGRHTLLFQVVSHNVTHGT